MRGHSPLLDLNPVGYKSLQSKGLMHCKTCKASIPFFCHDSSPIVYAWTSEGAVSPMTLGPGAHFLSIVLKRYCQNSSHFLGSVSKCCVAREPNEAVIACRTTLADKNRHPWIPILFGQNWCDRLSQSACVYSLEQWDEPPHLKWHNLCHSVVSLNTK